MSEMFGNSQLQHHSTAKWRRGAALRHGYTTAACAAAAGAAAAKALLEGEVQETITIDLPGEKQVTFHLATCAMSNSSITCGVIKDAGDDPDVTHGAEIRATVGWGGTPGITIAGGEGVGIVTRPGLPVPVGEAAINPGARRLIAATVSHVVGEMLSERGLVITISVPEGQTIAEKTLNPRLGIIGGISILGADGIVKPYSVAAYRATIRLALRVARRNGIAKVVLATGSRSERHARGRYPGLAGMAFVQVGDHVDCALKQTVRLHFQEVVIATMVGKASKLAQGQMQTHVSEGPVDLAALAEVASEIGADEALQAAVRAANTVHHAQKLLRAAAISGLEQRLAQLAAEQAAAFVGGAVPVEVLIYALDGALLGLAQVGSRA